MNLEPTMPTGMLEEHLEYLDALRESGATNMFGAIPYLVAGFDLSEAEAKAYLIYWMKTFGKRHPEGR